MGKKGKYKLYLYSYEYGWEKEIIETEEKAYKRIKELDPSEHGQYILVKILNDRDNTIDFGYVSNPNKKIKKLK